MVHKNCLDGVSGGVCVRKGTVLLEAVCQPDCNRYDWLAVVMSVEQEGVKKADANLLS